MKVRCREMKAKRVRKTYSEVKKEINKVMRENLHNACLKRAKQRKNNDNDVDIKEVEPATK